MNLTRRLAWDAPASPWALFDGIARRQRARYASLLDLPLPDGDHVAVVSGVARAVPALARPRRRDASREGNGSRRGAARGEREGPRRERDDRRPGSQRPRPGLRTGEHLGSRAVRARAPPRPRAPRQHGARQAATRRRPGRAAAATFPPASITGAPKPRVLQAIEDLEPVRRGVYCGAIGWLDTDRGCADLSVAIRTFTIAARRHVLRRRRRDRRRLRPCRRMARDRAQGVAPARDRGRGPGSDPAAGGQPLMHVWLNGVARRRRRGARLPVRPRAARRRRRLRDAARLRRGRPSRGGAISTGSPRRRTASACPFPIATSCAPRPASCWRPTESPTGGCASPSRAGPRRSDPTGAPDRPPSYWPRPGSAPGRCRAPSSWCPGPATSAARPRASRPSRTRTTSVPSPTHASTGRDRGRVRQHAGRAVRGDRVQRVRRRGWRRADTARRARAACSA